jgi:endonuclease YncB( thermonuclease family)
MIKILLLIALNFAIANFAIADVTGSARVVDGDTIHIQQHKIRLHGIDAPEQRQTCERDETVWNCGLESTITLRELINHAEVTCTDRGKDRYKRIVGVCYVKSYDLNAEMVRRGMAVAYRRYSKDYVQDEQQAKENGAGMWSGRFVMPWDWRKGKRLD